MILFTLLCVAALVVGVIIVAVVGAAGIGFVTLFGDVIICAGIIFLIVRHIWRKHH